ncbi:hypothetical protein ACRE_008000 [Hapsidospora chrysogenum ATCC 11550]|uniref:Uncharacterized protein n=1 Tax=Hapsidospora chrysogenum (strain ATCC 11550 / CBS 779.69 / DSM 880 / IAM 14645 / JCM 23072 / IMI 49137) TaxID=857340 RepID=A0A086TG16_HAPC1|nr:hypothetical protein ACRE_008000 [Hapsidospora chrysogenum ATCC 11550]
MGRGTLIPPWYAPEVPSCDDLAAASVVWGVSLGLTVFGVIRAVHQTFTRWRRTHRISAYIIFVWLELVSSTIIGGMAWGYVRQNLKPSLWYFSGMILLWIFQIHCILQIIITRIALLEHNKTRVFRLRWGVFFVLALINIVVAFIWIPARLQRSRIYIHANEIWDRMEKAIIAVIDVGLNAYFIYLVRSSLIAFGLSQYITLYRFNLAMIFVSVATDVGTRPAVLLDARLREYQTTRQRHLSYVCFHPLAYLVKLHIEMSMSELIAKIVKASGSRRCSACSCGSTAIPSRQSSHDLFLSLQQSQQRRRRDRNSSFTSPTIGGLRRVWHPNRTGRHSSGAEDPEMAMRSTDTATTTTTAATLANVTTSSLRSESISAMTHDIGHMIR